jgi:DNA modification methylase
MSDLHLFGTDLFGNPVRETRECKLAEDFIIPPFSVLSARDGVWQERKRKWLEFGIQSEVGRGSNMLGLSAQDEDYRNSKASYARAFSMGDGMEKYGGARGNENGTSVFDPVLCELSYRWFCPPAGQIIDPFAGGSVRGIVADLLGYDYWGCDLRSEQIEANREQAARICSGVGPSWVCGDSMDKLESAPMADFLFSCPPYGDLERYSDDPRDISTMDYHAFMGAYRRIILRACERLKNNRFACFVVGDFRNPKTGAYRNFVSDTIESFRQCGLELYNEAILLTPVGSLPIRVGKQFAASRKMGKTHQNILVFVKGDGRAAADACGKLQTGYSLI